VQDYEFVGAYDLSSIMHYGVSDFSKVKGQLTMQSKDNPIMEQSLGSQLRGARQPLSHRDAAALNKLFQCHGVCTSPHRTHKEL
jgi:hypothetical protein